MPNYIRCLPLITYTTKKKISTVDVYFTPIVKTVNQKNKSEDLEREREKMAECMLGLNPTKTLTLKLSSSINQSSSNSTTPQFTTLQSKSMKKNFTSIYASKSLSLHALTSSERRDQVMIAVKDSFSNCLSETNLHLTVPGLKSKTRGKVIVSLFRFRPCLIWGYSGRVFVWVLLLRKQFWLLPKTCKILKSTMYNHAMYYLLWQYHFPPFVLSLLGCWEYAGK